MKLITLLSTASLSIAGVSAGAGAAPAASTRPQLSVRTGVRVIVIISPFMCHLTIYIQCILFLSYINPDNYS